MRYERSERLHDIAQDVRYAARSLGRAPAFTAIVVATLAVGIGATTAIFSALDAFILRPLPYPEPDRLMHVSLTRTDSPARQRTRDLSWSYQQFLVFRDAQTVFAELALYSEAQFNTATDETERVAGEWITARYLPTLGLSVSLGRNFDAADVDPGAARQAIVSDGFWRRRFAADPAIVGQPLRVNGEPFTVIGVMPPGFSGLSGQSELFLPVTTLSTSALDPLVHDYNLVARLKRGVRVERAQTVVATLGSVVSRAFRDTRPGSTIGASARPLDDARVAPAVKRSMIILFGAVTFVLLIACVNVANLMLGRADSRRREIAIRLAIGAGRGRVVRLLLTEAMIIAGVAGALGVGIAWLGVRAMAAASPATVQVGDRVGLLGVIGPASIRLDSTALAFTACVALAVGILFGLTPALRATGLSLTSVLKAQSGARRSGDGAFGRSALVVGEVAVCIVLLAGSGLMLRSLTKLITVDPGFDPRGILTARLALASGAVGRDSLATFYQRVHERVVALPGVSAAAFGSELPMTGVSTTSRIVLLDRPRLDYSASTTVRIGRATPEWFDVLRIPLRRGRLFSTGDRPGAPPVVLINEAAARAFWPNDNPLGKRVAVNPGPANESQNGAEVIGVVGDVHVRPDSTPGPAVYLPFAQAPQGRMHLFLRAAGDAGALVPAVRAAVREIAPAVPLYDVQMMTTRSSATTAQTRFTSGILGSFSLIALSLATVGIYGVMSVLVGQRRREIGIRMALGATEGMVVRMVVGESLRVAALGAGLGLVAALPLTRVLRAMLYDVTPTDLPTYLGVILVFAAAAALASWVPARRAGLVQPLETLRSD
jgi:putative ABC transport system permease protein